MSQFFCTYESRLLGPLTLVSDGEALTGLWFSREQRDWASVRPDMVPAPELPVLVQAAAWLDRYFAGERPDPLELPLRAEGTEFRQRVWRLLAQIPYGDVVTYGDLARQLALETAAREGGAPRKMSAQAVGGAVGQNPLGIIVPCHRVVGADGSLTGFGGGLAAKIALLEHEGLDMSRFSIPAGGTGVRGL